jgi:hypothetical protein
LISACCNVAGASVFIVQTLSKKTDGAKAVRFRFDHSGKP